MKVKIILFVIIVTAITIFVFVQSNNKKSQTVFTSAAPPNISPVMTETANNMDSPDGSKSLTLEKKESSAAGLISYTLFVSTKPEEQKQEIFKKEETGSQNLSIPYNTWSPDNVYVFLKEKTTTIDNYLVFQSSGNLFPNNLSYLSIQELFGKNVPGFTIEDVTGWAASNLIIVNTKVNESDNKVSFWFDVPSQSFIQLGTYFK